MSEVTRHSNTTNMLDHKVIPKFLKHISVMAVDTTQKVVTSTSLQLHFILLFDFEITVLA